MWCNPIIPCGIIQLAFWKFKIYKGLLQIPTWITKNTY